MPVKHYVAATDWPGRSPFAPIVERVLLELLVQFEDVLEPEE